MLKDLNFLSSYDSYDNDISEEFYIPILKEAKSFDRITGYFSSKVLAYYSVGLEYFAKHNGKYRIITSFNNLSEKDFNLMKKGAIIHEALISKIENGIDYNILTDEEKYNFSNLAFLISIGLIEIKIAFPKTGIFHEKIGYCVDEDLNSLSFCGSNNETEGGIKKNYESFEVTSSWMSSEFDKRKIEKTHKKFNQLWDNQRNDILVIDIPEIVEKKIISYSKGGIFVKKILQKPDIILDIDDSSIPAFYQIIDNWDKKNITDLIFFHRRIRTKINIIEGKYIFKNNVSYREIKKIIVLFTDNMIKENYLFICTKRLKEHLKKFDNFIDERSKVGIEIKKQDSKYLDRFNKFSAIVNKNMIRNLRDKQMWDAFHMYVMKKDGNFSVPGSGKTSEVYGVFAALVEFNPNKKIVMIGPKSSFKSWIDEFYACFGSKRQLNYFSFDDFTNSGLKEKKKELLKKVENYNLILINYEAIINYEKEILYLINDDTILVFDEVHKVKNVQGKRALSCLKIAKKASYMLALSGTRVPNSYLDIYNLLHYLFPIEYTDFFGFDISQLKNPDQETIKLINNKFKPFYCRTTKKQLGVPEANEDCIIDVDSTIDELRIFEIINAKFRKCPFTRIIRILQLESNPKMLLKKLDFKDFVDVLDYDDLNEVDSYDYSSEIESLIKSSSLSTKFLSTITLIKSLAASGESVVVWTIFKDSSKRLNKELRKIGIFSKTITGDNKNLERGQLLEEFKDKKFQVLITNPQTLAESVSLHQVCHNAIYFEYSYNLVHLLQSKDRIHRLGLNPGQVTQYYFMGMNYQYGYSNFSLDKNIYNRLKLKEDIMLEAISNDILEGLPSSEEDIRVIFESIDA